MAFSSLQQVTADVRQLRRQRGPGAHLSEQLREAVAYLATNHDLKVLSRTLEISENTIKSWIKRYPALPKLQKPTRALTTTSAAKATPIEFFEIKTGTTAAPGLRSEDATASVEVTRPDGWTICVSGNLAHELAPAILESFTRFQGATTWFS